MIRVEISGKEYKIPSKHSEVTGKQLHSIREDKPKAIIKALTSIPDEIVEQLSHQAVMQLYGIMEFIYEMPNDAKVKQVIKVSSEAWLKIELAKQALETKNEPYIVAELCRIYFGDQALDWDVNFLYGQTAQIIDSIGVFLERYRELYEDNEPDPDQLEAGIKGLESFGVGAIRYSLAQGDVTKYKQVEQMSAESIYFTLLYEKAKNEYTDRLKEIYERQNGINSRKSS
jgi:hypothetical protein